MAIRNCYILAVVFCGLVLLGCKDKGGVEEQIGVGGSVNDVNADVAGEQGQVEEREVRELPKVEKEKEVAEANNIQVARGDMIVGQVKFIKIEGGFYALIADDGRKFNPRNLPGEFKRDGLRVRFNVREIRGAMSTRMYGKIVEVVEIERY